MSTINERLRDLRVACNLTQKEFGEMSNRNWQKKCYRKTSSPNRNMAKEKSEHEMAQNRRRYFHVFR